MRTLITLLALLLALLLAANLVMAQDLGPTRDLAKPQAEPGLNPGTPDGRQGGEDFDDALPIPSLPFSDTGNTADNVDDWEVACPYMSTSPDVFYTWYQPYTTSMDIDMCGSGYDTKVFVLDEYMNVVACNDDFYYPGDPCGDYVSYVEIFEAVGGIRYYIVIDGYGGDYGDYVMEMNEYSGHPPCELDCIGGVAEGEPELVDDYVDVHNAGCGQHTGDGWQPLEGDENGDLVFCGRSGWYLSSGAESRDTDWFTAIIGPSGVIQWDLVAELDTYGYLLGPNDCAEVGVLAQMEVEPCVHGSLTIQGEPGDVVWLWVAPTTFTPPGYAFWDEYTYISTFSGLEPAVVNTDEVSFDELKSLYR